jgi:hypothetical protein
MDTLTAPCGLQCASCPAYVATQTGDPAQVEGVAQSWARTWGVPVQPEHVWCDGCQGSSKRKWIGTWKCQVRACALERKVPTCAHCPDYVCETLEKFFSNVPRTRKILQKLRDDLRDE